MAHNPLAPCSDDTGGKVTNRRPGNQPIDSVGDAYPPEDYGFEFGHVFSWDEGLQAIEEFDWSGTEQQPWSCSGATRGNDDLDAREEAVLDNCNNRNVSDAPSQGVLLELSLGNLVTEVTLSSPRTPNPPPQAAQEVSSAKGNQIDQPSWQERLQHAAAGTFASSIGDGLSSHHENEAELPPSLFKACGRKKQKRGQEGGMVPISTTNTPAKGPAAKKSKSDVPKANKYGFKPSPDKARGGNTPRARLKEKSTSSVKGVAKTKVPAMGCKSKTTKVDGSTVVPRQTRSASANEEAMQKEMEGLVKEEAKESRMKTLRRRGE